MSGFFRWFFAAMGLITFWHDECRDDVGKQPRAAAEGEDDPQQTDDGGVEFKIFAKASAYAAEFFVHVGTIKLFYFHFC